jgi:hypothetical protein
MRKWRTCTLITVVASLTLVGACSSQNDKQTAEPAVPTPGGLLEVDTFRLSATVAAVDPAKRQLTLVGQDGGSATYTVGSDAANLDQIRVGDRVNATIVEQVALSVGPAGAPPSLGAAGTVWLAPRGAPPISASTIQITARVTAIDATTRRINLKFNDGSTRTYKAGTAVNLNAVRLGDSVTAVVSERLAILVQKP